MKGKRGNCESIQKTSCPKEATFRLKREKESKEEEISQAEKTICWKL